MPTSYSSKLLFQKVHIPILIDYKSTIKVALLDLCNSWNSVITQKKKHHPQ